MLHTFFCLLRIVCVTARSGQEKIGQALVKVQGGGLGLSAQIFSFQVCCCYIVHLKKQPIFLHIVNQGLYSQSPFRKLLTKMGPEF